jgi:hypothetical protein
MLRARDDLRDDDAIKRCADAFDAFDFVADHVEAFEQGVLARIQGHAFAQPVLGNLHGYANCRRKRTSFSKNARRSVTP